MDTYTWNIISRQTNDVEFEIVSLNRKNILEWVTKEFIFLSDSIRLLASNADIYHAVSPIATKVALLAGKSPIISTVHDLIPNSLSKTQNYYRIHTKQRRWLNPWYWWFLKRSDYFIATSEKNRRDLIEILEVPPEKITVIYYGVEPQKGAKPRTSYHTPKIILYLGAIDPGKGIFDIIKAFSKILKNVDCNLLIGGQGNALPVAKELAQKLNLMDKVKFLGFIPPQKLSYYYELADVFAFPSYYGFHLMYLTAMANGLPVVAYDAGYGSEYLGDAGSLVKPGDINQLANAIIDLLTNENHYKEKSKIAIDRAKIFSWDKMAKETLSVYKKLYDGKNSKS